MIEQRDGAITGCVVPYPPGPSSHIVSLDDVLGAVRFVPGELLALSVDGARVLRLDLGEPLPASELAGASGGEECEHLAELALLATLPEPATQLSVCPLDHALSWQASWTEGGDLLTSALGVGSADGWAIHPLSPARRATVGCLGEAVSVLSVEGERVTALRCSATCVEESALVPGLRPGALAFDLGERLALLEVRQDGALVGRFGTLASLADAPPVELVDTASAFVPVGTAGIDVRAGLALVLGRTPSGYGVLRVGSDGRAVPVPLRHRPGTVEVGEILRVDP